MEALETPSLVRLSYYPFLPEVRDVVRRDGPPLGAVLTSPLYSGIRERGLQRVEGALADGILPVNVVDEREGLHEVLSVAVARMLCVQSAERQLVARYAVAEARRVGAALARDADPASVLGVANALGVAAEQDPEGGGFRAHFSTYILHAPLADPEWKLIRRPVARGVVALSQADLARLCQEALQKRTQQELEAELAKPLPDEIHDALAPYAERLAPKLEAARESWTSGDFGPVQPGLFPPCVKELFEMMRRGQNIPHHGRFAFATFLGTVGWNAEQIMDYMATIPNFNREKSRYQIEHVTGGRGVDKYTPPGCATMQTHGICPLDKRDGLCARVKHPLSYYRAKIRFQLQDAQRSQQVPKGLGRATPEAPWSQAPQRNPASLSAPPPPATIEPREMTRG